MKIDGYSFILGAASVLIVLALRAIRRAIDRERREARELREWWREPERWWGEYGDKQNRL